MKGKILVLATFILTSITTQGHIQPTPACDVEFVIVITSYKNEKWAAENLASACTQKSSLPYTVICIDDCSPDRTGQIMDTYVRENNVESKVTIIHNKKRMGAIANWYNTVHQLINDHKVIVTLDGDDLLENNNVLLTLENYYRDPDIWLTYGQGRTFPSPIVPTSKPIPDWVFTQKKIREYPFCASHLRTFKAGLFKKIKKEDLFIEGGDLAPDMAFMLPMLEMCSPTEKFPKNHSLFIPELLYLHRKDNPLSVFRILGNEQNKAAELIKSKKPYQPIEKL